MTIYNTITKAYSEGKTLLAVLIDPDKTPIETIPQLAKHINQSIITHIFVGGSTVAAHSTEPLVKFLRTHTKHPVILFPGDVTQLTEAADALLFLSLVSGRNPDYLIDKHVLAAEKLKHSSLEVIPTAYLLIDGKRKTAVQRVTQTQPLSINNTTAIVNTAKASELLGFKLIYLEAGSGAQQAVPKHIISAVRKTVNIPIIVGGGIRTQTQLKNAYKAGATLVVIGTAFENDVLFFNTLKL